MFSGLTIEKIALIGFIAALIVGPERLPRYAENLAVLIRRARDWLQGARTRVKDEMGEDFDDVDWQKLDPRQYDPRRIIREALLDDAPAAAAAGSAPKAAVRQPRTTPLTRETFTAEAPPPFDSEAT
ncbi:Sec-independent protein translocase TatB [Microbacterium betulae]|uniref:Sec-independent protein translocase TatB n=1 Tax=Microbacterium betulae TaxID=2981139 RepID=A0AA97FK67_9MICO|nr:Sec-independent protein translocase TatB [Microbacterium sp. AB]WOF24446.1 Sec-independent protein translocase TatB [Microbacterium sp. AB]